MKLFPQTYTNDFTNDLENKLSYTQGYKQYTNGSTYGFKQTPEDSLEL